MPTSVAACPECARPYDFGRGLAAVALAGRLNGEAAEAAEAEIEALRAEVERVNAERDLARCERDRNGDAAEAAEAEIGELAKRIESLERELTASNTALVEISSKLPCDLDHTQRPEVRCGECHQVKSGGHWCAGCVARRGLRGETA